MFKTTRSAFAATAFAAALAAAAPVMAAPAGADAPAAAASPAPAITSNAKPIRYCVVETITGSRIPKKVCHSQSEWAAQGVDITKK